MYYKAILVIQKGIEWGYTARRDRRNGKKNHSVK